MILSRLLDDNWRRAVISDQEDLGLLLTGIFSSPLSAVLFLAVVLTVLSKIPFRRLSRPQPKV